MATSQEADGSSGHTIFCQRHIVLADLVALGQVGVEVLLAVKLGLLRNAALHGQARQYGLPHHFLIQDWQGALQARGKPLKDGTELTGEVLDTPRCYCHGRPEISNAGTKQLHRSAQGSPSCMYGHVRQRTNAGATLRMPDLRMQNQGPRTCHNSVLDPLLFIL